MKVIIIGYGKMGRRIEQILSDRGHRIAAIIDQHNSDLICADKLRGFGADVAIEFSTPGTAFTNVVECFRANLPVVSGSTGWNDRLEEAREICSSMGGTFFYGSNFSIGVNILFAVNRRLAQYMNPYPEYDVTIEEVHHTQKKDSPSGTAVTLAEGVLENIDRKSSWVGHTTTEPQELEVIGIRRSVVPGTHTVTYESAIDSITLTHTAKNRDGFAIGAVIAAEFLVGKKGIFSMSDLLGI